VTEDKEKKLLQKKDSRNPVSPCLTAGRIDLKSFIKKLSCNEYYE
jgi:hypothetical protein